MVADLRHINVKGQRVEKQKDFENDALPRKNKLVWMLKLSYSLVEVLKRIKQDKPDEDQFMNREMAIALIRGAGLLPPEEDNLDWASSNFAQLNQLVLLVQMAESATIAMLLQNITAMAEMEIAKEESELIQQAGVKLS